MRTVTIYDLNTQTDDCYAAVELQMTSDEAYEAAKHLAFKGYQRCDYSPSVPCSTFFRYVGGNVELYVQDMYAQDVLLEEELQEELVKVLTQPPVNNIRYRLFRFEAEEKGTYYTV